MIRLLGHDSSAIIIESGESYYEDTLSTIYIYYFFCQKRKPLYNNSLLASKPVEARHP